MRILKRTLIILVVFMVIGYLIAMLALSPIVSSAVKSGGPKLLGGTETTIESVDVGWGLNSFQAKNIFVGSPEGFKAGETFRLGEISVDYNLSSMMTDTIVVESILIDGAKITYETSFGSNNLEAIIDSLAGDKEAEVKEEDAEKGAGKNVIIRKVIVKNTEITVAFSIAGGGGVTIPMPDLELTDIGVKKEDEEGEDGTTYAEAVGEILNEILSSVTNAVSISDIGDNLKETGEDIGNSIKDTGKDISDGIKGLFK